MIAISSQIRDLHEERTAPSESFKVMQFRALEAVQ
jgi:hypothetical protein